MDLLYVVLWIETKTVLLVLMPLNQALVKHTICSREHEPLRSVSRNTADHPITAVNDAVGLYGRSVA